MADDDTDDFLSDLRDAVEQYDVREVHPNLRMGTASDRFAAWLGQVYPLDVWADQVDVRPKKTARGTFEERLLPIASAEDYFQHFSVLELDFTYYRPLRSADGKDEPGAFTLRHYAEVAPPEPSVYLKCPRDFFGRIRRSGTGANVRYEPNPTYLDADAYLRQFHEPSVEILGDALAGVIFEQEYGRVADTPPVDEVIADFDRFFAALPSDVQPHLELRSPHLLTAPYFDWLDGRGLGFVFSHWQYLPPIRDQWKACGQRFTAADGSVVCRLLSQRGMSFEDAYAKAYPFEQTVPEWEDAPEVQRMVLDAVALLYRAEASDNVLNLILNNRATGNAPDLARRIATRVLDEEAKRAL